MGHRSRGVGFTLIELLVVIAVIAVLIGVLLPTLSKSRDTARTLRCKASIRSVGQAVTVYSTDFRYFPPAYVYGSDETSLNWRLEDQKLRNPVRSNGYVHWSAFLLSNGSVSEQAFTCPSAPRGGAPRTNPGARDTDWDDGQVNDLTAPAGASPPQDRQVSRIAYGGNDAVFTRNKFTLDDGSARKNQFVNPSWIDGSARGAGGTILAAEFGFSKQYGWRTLAETSDSSGSYLLKSHRPFTPFVGGSAGGDVYNEAVAGGRPRFFYPQLNDFTKGREPAIGALVAAPDGGSATTLDAVARHHTGGKDQGFGGSGNFVFLDGHVEQSSVLDTVRNRRWGDKFYSISGPNSVDLQPRAGDP